MMAKVVAFEGLSGGGKSSVIKMLCFKLRSDGYRAVTVDLDICGKDSLLRQGPFTFPQGHPGLTITFWVLRLRQDEMLRKVEDDFDVILVDRHWGSTLANDVHGYGVPREVLEWVARGIKRWPDLTILLDIPVSVAKMRKDSQTMRNLAFANRVERGFRELAEESSWTVVNANRELDVVVGECFSAVQQLL